MKTNKHIKFIIITLLTVLFAFGLYPFLINKFTADTINWYNPNSIGIGVYLSLYNYITIYGDSIRNYIIGGFSSFVIAFLLLLPQYGFSLDNLMFFAIATIVMALVIYLIRKISTPINKSK